jgi:hypothetical protein
MDDETAEITTKTIQAYVTLDDETTSSPINEIVDDETIETTKKTIEDSFTDFQTSASRI